VVRPWVDTAFMSTVSRHIRLLIADDDTLFREALRLLLQTDPHFDVVGYAIDGAETVALAHRLNPDVLLIDLKMPRMSGLDAMREISAASLPVRMLVLTGWMARQDVLTALLHGARGIVKKDASPELLFKSIHAVMDGQYWIDREAVSDLVAALRHSAPPPSADAPPRRFNLTPRELQIVAAIVKGCSNKDIASDLGITEVTVKHHLTSIFDKVGVPTRLELALFAINHGLV
jgi:DNA-binding NarL/FixJ family response regulator